MTTKAEKERLKLIQEKSQQILSQLLKDDDNKYCVDCDAKGPRWASWNLGVFLCIRCAGIHRNLGVHISKVKSVNLDSWSPEQVAHMQRMGNSKARAVYEANLPDNFKRPQGDSQLEAFIREKYEKKKYIAKEWVQPPTPPPAFDIEEERKKDKEKKKAKPISKSSAGSAGEVQTNPLPRPATTSASSAIPAAISVDKVLSAKKASTDLLGLSLPAATAATKVNIATAASPNDDDQFDAFVGCEPLVSTADTSAKSSGGAKSIDNEEDDFFKQKAPEEKKLDKESILKLYGSAGGATSANFFQVNNNLGGLVGTTGAPLSTASPFGAANPTTINSVGPIPFTSNAFATTSGTNPALSTGFANFSQPIPPATNMPYIPQPNGGTTNSVNFFQSSTNPFLSPGKSMPDNATASLTTSLSTSSLSSVPSSTVNQLQSALGYLDIGSLSSSWLPPTSVTNEMPVTNPFIQPASNHHSTSNGSSILSPPADLSALSSSPFGTSNGSSILNGFAKPKSTNDTAGPMNGTGAGLLDITSNALSSTSANANFATANLWQ